MKKEYNVSGSFPTYEVRKSDFTKVADIRFTDDMTVTVAYVKGHLEKALEIVNEKETLLAVPEHTLRLIRVSEWLLMSHLYEVSMPNSMQEAQRVEDAFREQYEAVTEDVVKAVTEQGFLIPDPDDFGADLFYDFAHNKKHSIECKTTRHGTPVTITFFPDGTHRWQERKR